MATEIQLNSLARYQRNTWPNISEMGGPMTSELSTCTEEPVRTEQQQAIDYLLANGFTLGHPAESTPKLVAEKHMNAAKITGIILIVIGLAGLFTGGFSFTKNTTAAKIGPLELKVQEKESVNIPQWLSLGALALGGLVLVIGFRKP